MQVGGSSSGWATNGMARTALRAASKAAATSGSTGSSGSAAASTAAAASAAAWDALSESTLVDVPSHTTAMTRAGLDDHGHGVLVAVVAAALVGHRADAGPAPPRCGRAATAASSRTRRSSRRRSRSSRRSGRSGRDLGGPVAEVVTAALAVAVARKQRLAAGRAHGAGDRGRSFGHGFIRSSRGGCGWPRRRAGSGRGRPGSAGPGGGRRCSSPLRRLRSCRVEPLSLTLGSGVTLPERQPPRAASSSSTSSRARSRSSSWSRPSRSAASVKR